MGIYSGGGSLTSGSGTANCISIGNESLTVTAWCQLIKFNSVAASVIFKITGSVGSQISFLVFQYSSGERYLNWATQTAGASAKIAPINNTWFHAAFSLNRSNSLTIWLDGAIVAYYTGVGTTTSIIGSTQLNSTGGSPNPWKLSNLHIYKRSLSHQEVIADMNGETLDWASQLLLGSKISGKIISGYINKPLDTIVNTSLNPLNTCDDPPWVLRGMSKLKYMEQKRLRGARASGIAPIRTNRTIILS
jgi:hypothetical protein